MTLKIAVFAAIPNASVSTAMAVKPGFFHNKRTPKRASRSRWPITSSSSGRPVRRSGPANRLLAYTTGVLSTLAIAGYRSLRDLVIPLRGLTLVTGPNGSGKSSLYRALRLLAETAQGRLVPTLAREGGLHSTLWAGPESFSRSVLRGEHPVQGTRRKNAISLKLGFAGEDFGYAIDLGLPGPNGVAAFAGDPHIKRECVWSGDL